MQSTLRPTGFKVKKSIHFVLLIGCLTGGFADASSSIAGQNQQSRYVPGVISIIQDHRYIRAHEAPIYWRISPYYLPQPTDSSCSLASATMVINALRIPQMQYANQKLATTDSVVHSTNKAWANDVKPGGDGVTLDQFGAFLKQALQAYQIKPTQIKVIHATKVQDITTKFHQALVKAEKTGKTFIIVNFDQKFISGTESVGHFAPIGAYDVKTKRVLIMDPDRELFEPYWMPEQRLLQSMATEDSSTQQNRGFVIVTVKE